jgi:hypothetical protein
MHYTSGVLPDTMEFSLDIYSWNFPDCPAEKSSAAMALNVTLYIEKTVFFLMIREEARFVPILELYQELPAGIVFGCQPTLAMQG